MKVVVGHVQFRPIISHTPTCLMNSCSSSSRYVKTAMTAFMRTRPRMANGAMGFLAKVVDIKVKMARDAGAANSMSLPSTRLPLGDNAGQTMLSLNR